MLPIQVRRLTKRYGRTLAVDAVDLDIPAGELFFLLGPSGCGKTTLLRMLAGLTRPTTGTVRFGDRDVSHLPANRRNTGMVFQGYALWPHLTVWQNVAFGLKVRRLPVRQVRQRVHEVLSLVELADLAQRKPNELSGGQQQRVALARALAVQPAVLLLDEPLSNLDAKLRLQMRAQIRDICQRARITAVYVTHDQKEALSTADRLAILHAGRIVQVGPPQEVYRRPATRFVAEFLGETIFLPAAVLGQDGDLLRLQTPVGVLVSSCFPPGLGPQQAVSCALRPESLAWSVAQDATIHSINQWTASVLGASYLGEIARLELQSHQTRLSSWQLNPRSLPAPGTLVRLVVDPRDVLVLAT